MDRRTFLAGGTALAGGMALGSGLAGCSVPDEPAASIDGGALRLGLAGGASSDSLDPRTYMDWVAINIGYQIMNGLVEIDEHREATPELLESWEPAAGATEWIFNVRRGVLFHNGKTLDADDVIYSVNLHRGDTRSASKGVLENLTDIRKLDSHQIKITLAAGDAELPATLSDYRLLVVPDGFSDWDHPIGTGGYKLESFEPGVRCITRKARDYWKPNAAHVEAIEVIVVNDAVARINALTSGQVDIVNQVDGRTASLLKRNQKLQIVRSQTGHHAVLAMNCERDPYTHNDIRLALKYAIDREHLVKVVLNGYGQVGNDQPVPLTNRNFDPDIPQHTFDPDRARFHLKRAGYSTLKATLQVSEASFSGALDSAVLFQAAAAAAGVTLEVKREPSDGYWSSVWQKAPFCGSYSDGRPTVDAILSKAYKSTSSTNDCHWYRPDFDRLANQARAEVDAGKRKALYGECQRMIWEEGGALIPMFMDHVEAGSSRVQGWKPAPIYDLMGARIGEKVWLRA